MRRGVRGRAPGVEPPNPSPPVLPKRGGHGIPIHGGGKGRPGTVPAAAASDPALAESPGRAAAVTRGTLRVAGEEGAPFQQRRPLRFQEKTHPKQCRSSAQGYRRWWAVERREPVGRDQPVARRETCPGGRGEGFPGGLQREKRAMRAPNTQISFTAASWNTPGHRFDNQA